MVLELLTCSYKSVYPKWNRKNIPVMKRENWGNGIMLFLLSYARGGNLTHAQLDTNKLCKYTVKRLNWLLVSLCACLFLAFSLGWKGGCWRKGLYRVIKHD